MNPTVGKIDDAQIIAEAIRLVNEGVEVIFPVKGWSMRPFIEGDRDSVLLVRPVGVKPMDVVLARIDEKRYVVHRILSVDENRVTLMGDGNLLGREYCNSEDVCAKVTHVVRPSGRRRSLESAPMRFAQKMWLRLLPVRKYLLKFYRIYNRIREW